MAGRPTKYAHLVKTLPKLPGVEPERRDVVEAAKAEILAESSFGSEEMLRENLDEAGEHLEVALDALKGIAKGQRHASALALGYAAARGMKDRLKDTISIVQVTLDAYESLMMEQFEVEGVASVRMTDGGSVSTYQEPYPSVVDKEAFRVWCVANGLESKMHLWPSTTAALVKEMLMDGQPEPPGVTVYSKTMVRLNKA